MQQSIIQLDSWFMDQPYKNQINRISMVYTGGFLTTWLLDQLLEGLIKVKEQSQ